MVNERDGIDDIFRKLLPVFLRRISVLLWRQMLLDIVSHVESRDLPFNIIIQKVTISLLISTRQLP